MHRQYIPQMRKFRCDECSAFAPATKRRSRKTPVGHVKNMYCIRCRKVTRHVQVPDDDWGGGDEVKLSELNVSVRLDGVDAATEKATELAQKISEAKTLAGELASLMEKLEVEIKV